MYILYITQYWSSITCSIKCFTSTYPFIEVYISSTSFQMKPLKSAPYRSPRSEPRSGAVTPTCESMITSTPALLLSAPVYLFHLRLDSSPADQMNPLWYIWMARRHGIEYCPPARASAAAEAQVSSGRRMNPGLNNLGYTPHTLDNPLLHILLASLISIDLLSLETPQLHWRSRSRSRMMMMRMMMYSFICGEVSAGGQWAVRAHLKPT